MNEHIKAKAQLLMDQVLLTWNPPIETGNERPADIAQTSVMQTIWFLMGDEFLPELTDAQQRAIDGGRPLYEELLRGGPKLR